MPQTKNLIRQWNERLRRVRIQSPWTASLVILSSAALGGIAVAVWNRKALATFRNLEGDESDDPRKNDTETKQLDLGLEEDFF